MTPAPGKLVPPEAYRAVYDPQAGFERVCSLARQSRALQAVRERPGAHVLEIGCGSMILARMARDQGVNVASWTVVEPWPEFADAARAAMAGEADFHLVQGYVEDSASTLRGLRPQGFGVVILAGLLHETADPAALLRTATGLAAPGARVHASVPNALSFHRLLAVAAGLIPRPDALSDRDRALGHPVVFDRAGLTALMQSVGLVDLDFDGYLFKPFTHVQMEMILPEAPPALIKGLIDLGRAFPEQAAEICITATWPGEAP